jgi:hypothetical protein
MEKPVWLELRSQGLAAKCNVISVVPTVAELPASSTSDVAVFVSTEFARTLNATRTPTTVITDANGRVLWMKESVMSTSDTDRVLQLLSLNTTAAK